MEERFKTEVKPGWRFAADAARIKDTRAVRIASVRRVVPLRQSIGSYGQRRRNRHVYHWKRRKNRPCVGECQRRFAWFLFFWHSEGWTPRNDALTEAVVKQARTTRHPSLVAGDASMDP